MEIKEGSIQEVISVLNQIEDDYELPKSIKIKIKNSICTLQDNCIIKDIKIDKSLQELDDLIDDPILPAYAKTQVLHALSLLESI